VYTWQDLERDVQDLQQALEAQCVFVTNEAGQVITLAPENTRVDVAVMGALAVANLAATQQIVRLVTDGVEQDAPRFLNVELPGGGIFLCQAKNNLTLIVVLGMASSLGWARLMTQKMISYLEGLTSIGMTPEADLPSEQAVEQADLAECLLGQLDQWLS